MEQYEALRREFLSVAKFHITSKVLCQLKNTFKEAINSVRASEYIENIEDLVKILEKRGVIRYDQISPLKHIAHTYLLRSSIVTKLEEYERWVASHTPLYPPNTNLYKLGNGECHLRRKIENNIPSESFLNKNIQSFSRYKDPYVSPLAVFINNDLSDFNNSSVSLCFMNDPLRDENPLRNNINLINNLNDNDKSIKDCKLRVVPYKVYNITENKEDDNMILPSDSISESRKNDNSKHSSTEDLCIIDKAIPSTRLISTPRSVEPRTTVSSSEESSSLSPHNSLKRLRLEDNVKTARNRLNLYIKKLYVKIAIGILFFVIILSTIFIFSGFLKPPVQYIPEPSAPSFQEVHTGHPQTSSSPYPEYGPSSVQNRRTVPHPALQTSPPLQTLNEREARLQQKVFEKVSRELGPYWQDVGRYLGIRECDINNIDQQYSSLQEKAYEALRMFARETDLHYWQRDLRKALDKARRRDLMEAVEELASRTF